MTSKEFAEKYFGRMLDGDVKNLVEEVLEDASTKEPLTYDTNIIEEYKNRFKDIDKIIINGTYTIFKEWY